MNRTRVKGDPDAMSPSANSHVLVKALPRALIKTAALLGLLAPMLLASPHTGRCSVYTPLSWQMPIDSSRAGEHPFWGQRKHTNWVRDRNHNFIDDVIDHRFRNGDSIDVIVELNRGLPLSKIHDRFAGFGQIGYIGRIISFVLVDRVPFARLDSLASLEDVAMVEWQVPGTPQITYSARAVESRKSKKYSGMSAEEHDPSYDGSNVTIAFLDTGVDDYDSTTKNGHDALPQSIHGFDAVTGVDPGDGGTNPCASTPADCSKHGTYVAGVALSRGVADINCYSYGDPGSDEKAASSHCVGVAPGANLVDIRVCKNDDTCDPAPVLAGLDWLAQHVDAYGIRVANMSIGYCVVDDQTSAVCELVDYVAAMGTTMVVAHGNYDRCDELDTTIMCNPSTPSSHWRAMPPGTASHAITVSGVNDKLTVKRDDDVAYSNGLRGPLCDFATTKEVGKLKPDICAPADGIMSTELLAKGGKHEGYALEDGTSMAAPHVAGAAAIILQAQPSMDAASLKDLLLTTADSDHNTKYDTSLAPPWNRWDRRRGMGILNIGDALTKMDEARNNPASDVGFPSCVGDPGSIGSPCLLASNPPWLNEADIVLNPTTPVPGVENTITAHVKNYGSTSATAQVEFGVYDLGTGTRRFYELGQQSVTLGPSEMKNVVQTWVPVSSMHESIQVNIAYGSDSKYWNNTTQLDLGIVAIMAPPGVTGTTTGSSSSTAKPPTTTIRVLNPFMVPARFTVDAKVRGSGWDCVVNAQTITIDPETDSPVDIGVRVTPEPGATSSCDCDIYVHGGPQGRLIGGATVRAVTSLPSELKGQIVNAARHGVRGVHLAFFQESPSGENGPPIRATSGVGGEFTALLSPGLTYRLRLEGAGIRTRDIGVTPSAGNGLRVRLTPQAARALSYPLIPSSTPAKTAR